MTMVTFPGGAGAVLAARLDMPAGEVKAHALFAHCFTCTKDVFAASRIAARLTAHGIAVMRFDFTGLGESEGDFANTNFSSNVQDLIAAADFMRANLAAPKLIIGHSLGGSAILAAARHVAEARAVVTIGSPANVAHVIHTFGEHADRIRADGEVALRLVGRPFTIRRQFIEDVEATRIEHDVATLRKALLVLHAPRDQTVGIENALQIFTWAKHPKSYVSLDDADHLLSRRQDAVYAADVIATWSRRYIE